MELVHEIDKAVRNIPENYVLKVEIRSTGIKVFVYDIRGRGIDFPDSDDLAEMIYDATQAAIEWHG